MFTQLLILAVVSLFAVGSAILVYEKKERQRSGLTDYYDNPIEKEKESE